MDKKIIFTTELFYILTFFLAIFSIFELFWPGLVLSRINLNWVLIFWLVDGMVLLTLNKKMNV